MSGLRLSNSNTPSGIAKQISLPDCSSVHLLVVGDLMLDRYFHGAANRISPEAPVPVLRVENIEEHPGGAANVAVNITSLEAKASLIGLVGTDDNAVRLRRVVEDCGVTPEFIACKDATTTVKSRIVSCGQQLMRLDFECGLHGQALDELERLFSGHIGKVDAVILSDYAKGCLVNIEKLIALAREHGKPVFADPKGTDFSRYCGVDVLTPNRTEFEAVVGPCQSRDKMAERAVKMSKELGIGTFVITLGKDGVLLIDGCDSVHHFPARAHEVYDVTGAGDTVVSVFATMVATGASHFEAVQLANQAAGLVVEKSGTATVTMDEFARYGHHPRSICSEAELLRRVANAKARGQRIVMTNGCFDLLHAGHVAFLTQAATLGDRLLVAVNSDESVAAIKADNRPVNPLEKRMRVVAALAMVDWVVPFSEQTPERLITAISPDVLTKGGDYAPDQIAGAQHVKQQGGEVIVLDYIEGNSTTELITAIRN